jgi:hypothetical protein
LSLNSKNNLKNSKIIEIKNLYNLIKKSKTLSTKQQHQNQDLKNINTKIIKSINIQNQDIDHIQLNKLFDIINHVIDLTYIITNSKKLIISKNLATDTNINIYQNKEDLFLLITNILSLSIYFAKNNSKVTISSKLTSNNLILTIKDISNILDINLRRKIDIRYKDIDQLSNKLKIKIIYKNNKDHNICQLSIPLNNKDNIVYLHQ